MAGKAEFASRLVASLVAAGLVSILGVPTPALADCTQNGSEWQCTAGSFDGAVSSEETLSMSGAGTLTLGSTAVVDGNIQILGGILIGNTDNLTGHSGALGSSMAIGSGAQMTFDQASDGSYDGNISGAGRLVKTGTGRLVLTGNNSVSQTQVLMGTLVGDTDSLKGQITVSNPAASLEIAQDMDGTLAALIQSNGSVRKTGTGRVVMGSAIQAAGQVQILQGTLVATSGNLAAQSGVAVSNGATLEFAQGTDGTFNWGIQNNGSIVKNGTGRLLLAGNVTSSGQILVQQGTLAGSTTALGNNVFIGGNGSLEFTQTTNGVYAKSLSGSGTLLKTGTGRVELTGNNSFTGLTNIQAGTLAGTTATLGNLISIGGNGSLEFAQTANGTYAGTLSGAGTLLKTGAGKLSLTGNYSVANATVSQGELETVGTMSAPMSVNVQSGARLSGLGNFGNLNVAGTFAPRSYSGVAANTLTLASGSTYEIRMADSGSADHVSVTGQVVLNGATLRILPQGSNFKTGVTSTILTAGNISGTFGTTTLESATFRSTLSYKPTEVQVTLEQIKTLREAVTQAPSQGPAAVLDQISGSATGGIATLLEQLYSLDQPTLEKTMHTISGAEAASVPSMGTASTAALTGGIAQRMADLRFNSGGGAGGGGSLLTQAAFSGGNPDMAMSRMVELAEKTSIIRQAQAMGVGTSGLSDKDSVWVRGVGGWGARGATDSFSRQTYQMYGVIVGADMPLSEDFTAGTAFGYANGSSKTDDGSLKGDSTTYFASGYGGWSRGAWHIDGSLGLARHDLGSDRVINLGGGTFSTATGDHRAYELMGDIGTSYRFDIGNETTLEPLVGLSLSKMWDEAWTETGAGGANLRIDDSSRFTATSRVGFGIWRTFTTDDGYVFTPQFETMWLRALADRDTTLVAGFAEAAGSNWKVAGRQDPLNSAMFGLSGTLEFDDVSVSVGWAGRFAEDSVDHAVRLRLGTTW